MRGLHVLVAVAVLVLMLPQEVRAATEPFYLYPEVDGFPNASLGTTAPTYSGPMPDIDGNGKQGRRVDKSDKGLSETDSKHYHQWSAPAGGLEVTGAATLTIWFADKSFDGGDTNRLVAYLLDCGSSGCTTLATAAKDVAVPDGENVFKETSLTFPAFGPDPYTFASGRNLRLRIMIDKDYSDDDMTLAYGTTGYMTRLKLNKVLPPTSTTSTSTSTTSTTSTSTTSTTTTLASSTTTTGASTTTSVAATSTSSGTATTSVAVEPTTTSSSTTSTTTALATTTTEAAASAGPPTTSLGPPPPPQQQDLDTEKTNLVIRTTPAQRGILVSSPSVELSPVEGLMVTFVTAAETVKSNLFSAVGLGLIMASLLVLGMSRRREEDPRLPGT